MRLISDDEIADGVKEQHVPSDIRCPCLNVWTVMLGACFCEVGNMI